MVSHLAQLLRLQVVDQRSPATTGGVDKGRSTTMITMNLDADTYLRWLTDLANLWFEKGAEPSIVRKRNSGIWKVTRIEAA